MGNIKKLLFVFVALMLATTTVHAQTHKYYDTKHEVGVSVGVGANTEIIGVIGDAVEIVTANVVLPILTGGLTGGYSLESQKYIYGDASYYPTVAVEYYYHVNRVIGLGGIMAYNGMSRDMFVTVKDNETGTRSTQKTGVAKRHNFSIIPTAKFDWLRKKNFGMYSKLGVGVSFLNESQKDDAAGGTDYSNTDAVVNFQCSLLGIEVGSQRLRGFVEAGVGERGIFSAGLQYKF